MKAYIHCNRHLLCKHCCLHGFISSHSHFSAVRRKPRRRNSAAKTTEALQLSVPSENIDCDFSNYHKEIEECRLIILSGNVEKLKIFLCDTHFDLDALRFEVYS